MELAGKFECVVPVRYEDHERRILYVGKATAGLYVDVDVAKLFSEKNSPFWNYARSISRLADPDCGDLSNLAWSNIFKQGVAVGNPSGQVAEEQREEAEAELRREAAELKPSLIVLVNAGYYEEIPKAAFLIGDDEVTGMTQTKVPGENKNDIGHGRRTAHSRQSSGCTIPKASATSTSKQDSTSSAKSQAGRQVAVTSANHRSGYPTSRF
jgi:hypothetical protein